MIHHISPKFFPIQRAKTIEKGIGTEVMLLNGNLSTNREWQMIMMEIHVLREKGIWQKTGRNNIYSRQ